MPANFESINPTTGESIASYPAHSDAVLEQTLENITSAARDWRHRSTDDRAALIAALAPILRERKAALADLMAREVGKPVTQGQAEIEKCALLCEIAAQAARNQARTPQPELIDPAPSGESAGGVRVRHSVAHPPLGVVLAIMPWNFPFWQYCRAAIPALRSGNGVILKPAPNSGGCALALAECLTAAGLPPALVPSVLIHPDQIARLIDAPRVHGGSFTGSTAAGRIVGARAGAALKPAVLELGGSDPYLILADADVPAAARLCAASRMINGGQSCIAAKRFIVVRTAAEAFTAELPRAMAGFSKKMGDPLSRETQLGPLARFDLRQTLHAQVQASVAAGAKIALGGSQPDGSQPDGSQPGNAGAFYPATVLTDVPVDSPAGREELFGPVAPVFVVADTAAAVALANRTQLGLGAAIFSADVSAAEQLVRTELAAGAVAINDFVRSDARLPFGGI